MPADPKQPPPADDKPDLNKVFADVSDDDFHEIMDNTDLPPRHMVRKSHQHLYGKSKRKG